MIRPRKRQRLPITAQLRFRVLERDKFKCVYCGMPGTHCILEVDHVTPVAGGGTNDMSNLAASCADCNAGKSSTPPDAPLVANVADDALRWARAMEKATELDRKSKDDTAPVIRAVDRKWKRWHVADDPSKPLPRPSDWKQNVENFIASGLVKDDLIDAIEVTMGAKGVYNRNLWRYFCGVCWNKVRARQEIARALIESEGGSDGR